MNKTTIDINAKIIWHLLCESNEEMSIYDLHKASGLSIEDIYISIGWLAREDKIIFNRDNNTDNYHYMSQRYYF